MSQTNTEKSRKHNGEYTVFAQHIGGKKKPIRMISSFVSRPTSSTHLSFKKRFSCSRMDSCCLFVDDYICSSSGFEGGDEVRRVGEYCRHPRTAAHQHCRVQGSGQVMCAGSSDFPSKSLDLLDLELIQPPVAPAACWLAGRVYSGAVEPVVGRQQQQQQPAAGSSCRLQVHCNGPLPCPRYLMADRIFSSLATHLLGSSPYLISEIRKKG